MQVPNVMRIGVGKSCILMQFLDNKFKIDSENTVGVEFGSKVIEVSSERVKLQIWDTVRTSLPRQGRKYTSPLLDRITGDRLEQCLCTM